MRTLADTLKALVHRQSRHAVQPKPLPGGFSRSPLELPPLAQPFTAAALPIGLTYTGDTVQIGLGGVLISGDRKTGVSSTVRTLAVAAAKFPAARLHVYDDSGEWVVLRTIAHRFVTRAHGIADGLSDDTAAAQALADLHALRTEMQRRDDHLRDLNDDLAAAGHDLVVNRLDDLAGVPLTVLRAAGIDPARTDTEASDLHRHVVIIANLAWWLTHDPHGTGPEIAEQLFWLAGIGDELGIHLILAITARDLATIPPALRARITTRIALRITNPDHADLILGAPARHAGADTTHTAHQAAPMLAWIALPRAGGAGHRHRLVQLYRCSPMRLHRSIGRCHHDRDQSGWLTGDAAALNAELAAYHAEQTTRRTDRDDDSQGRR
jgi:hypothetical protein